MNTSTPAFHTSTSKLTVPTVTVSSATSLAVPTIQLQRPVTAVPRASLIPVEWSLSDAESHSIRPVTAMPGSCVGMSEEEKREVVINVWGKLLLFHGCSRGFVGRALDLSKQMHVKPEEIILREDEYSEDMIFVEQGALIIQRDDVRQDLGKSRWTLHQNAVVTTSAVLGLQQHSRVDVLGGHDGTLIRRLKKGDLETCVDEFPQSGAIFMTRTADIEKRMVALKGIDFFNKYRVSRGMGALSDHFVMLMAERIRQRHYGEGQYVVKIGDEGDDMYILEEGECVVEVNVLTAPVPPQAIVSECATEPTDGTSSSTTSSKLLSVAPRMRKSEESRSIKAFRKELSTRRKFNEKIAVQTLHPGAMFGELGMLGIAKIRSASIKVVSEEGASVLRLRRKDLRMVMAQFPEEHQAFEEYVEEIAAAHLKTLNSEVELHSVSYFANSDPDFCEMLQAFCERRIVLPGVVIVQEGMEGDDLLYVIHKGKLNVELLGRVIAEIADGDCFGEATMLRISPKYTASIRTSTLVSLIVLARNVFEQALNKFPQERLRFEALFQARILKKESNVGPEAHTFFQEGEEGFLQRIKDGFHLSVFMPDQVIVSEGDVGTSMFILSTGKAEAMVRGIRVSEYEAGAVFGELTLLGIASRRTATIKAVTVCTVDILHQHVFESALAEFPAEKHRFEELARTHLGHNCDYSIYSWPFFKQCPSRFLYLLDIHLVRLVYFTGTAIVDLNAVRSDENVEDRKKLLTKKSTLTAEDIDWSSSMFTLLRGRAEIIEYGKETQVLEDGEVFGEMAVVGIPTSPAITVVARTMCDIHVLRKDDVDAAFEEFPEERTRLHDHVAKYLVHKQHQQQKGEGGNFRSKSLRRATVFHKASPAFLDYLWEHLETRLVMPGNDIVIEGEMSLPCMYILQRGVATVIAQGREVNQLSGISYFGEIGLLGASTKRTATIRAKEACIIQVLHREQFNEAQSIYPDNNAGFQKLEEMAQGHLGAYLRRMLEQMPLFKQSDPSFLDALCDGLEEKTFAPGDVVIDEKDPMKHSVKVLVSGSLTMFVGGVQMGNVEAGENIFGEISGLGIGRWHPATLTCGKDDSCLVIEIDQSVFEQALTDHPAELARFQSMDEHRRRRASKKLRDHKSWLQSIYFEISQKVDFFSNCSKQFIWELTELLSETVHPPKTILAKDRRKSDSMIVLMEGTADILVDSVRLGKLRAGAVFGDENILGFPWRTATLQARSACRTVTIESDAFWDVLDDSTFAEDRRYFEDLRSQRAEAGAQLQPLLPLMKCEPLCLQQIALRANCIRIASGQFWVPGYDVGVQGEAFSIFLKGNAFIELDGLQVLVLTPGMTFAEKTVRRYGGIVQATTRSVLYSLRRHDLSAAVLHFPKAQSWFDAFCSQQNHECRQLELKLAARRAESEAFLPHPKDPELKHWAKIKDSRRKMQNPRKFEHWGAETDRSSRSSRQSSPRKEKVSPRNEMLSHKHEKAVARQGDLCVEILSKTAITLARRYQAPLRTTPRTLRKLLRQKRKTQEDWKKHSSRTQQSNVEGEPFEKEEQELPAARNTTGVWSRYSEHGKSGLAFQRTGK